MVTISFYSYKGGVGRSLALTNLGVYLAQFGATVVILDFDLEAPGLQYKIQPGTEPITINSRGVAGILADATTGIPPPEIDYDIAIDLTEHVNLPIPTELKQEPGRLLLIPAGDPRQRQYWSDLSAIDWTRLFSDDPRPGVAALARLRTRIIDDYHPDVLLVDSRTGITPSAGVSTTLLPDVVVTFLLNTPEHLDGSRVVVRGIVDRVVPGGQPPLVVPVISRYTARVHVQPMATERATRHAVLEPPNSIEDDAFEEDIPFKQIHAALTNGLDDVAAARVASPLVLHTDLALQREEHLWFGRYAAEITASGRPLLDDYLRLFASIVPLDVVSRHVTGVRSRARAIILDQPDDAIRTLENLAGLVRDEGVFVDLIKLHVLRRDTQSILRAAERLFRVHHRIVVIPEISSVIRDELGESSPIRSRQPSLSPTFIEAYWRQAAADDFEWGAGVARYMAEAGRLDQAERVAEEIITSADDPDALAAVVKKLASGSTAAERLSVRLAQKHFDLGNLSSNFIQAAALACMYQPIEGLAQRIAESPVFASVREFIAVKVLRAAGRDKDASALLVRALGTLDPEDRAVERLREDWRALLAGNDELRNALRQRYPRIVEILESQSDDDPLPRRRGRRSEY